MTLVDETSFQEIVHDNWQKLTDTIYLRDSKETVTKGIDCTRMRSEYSFSTLIQVMHHLTKETVKETVKTLMRAVD